MTLWSYEYGQKLLQKPVSQACPSNNSLTTHSAGAIFHRRWKNKTRQNEVSYNGRCGFGAFLPAWTLEIKSKKG